jgi:hypothetical protein
MLKAEVRIPMDQASERQPEKPRRSWLWPVGAVAAGVTGAALVLVRGCWHRKMSWPLRIEGCSYQVCLGCGVKRLFDEQTFRSYGPFSYDLEKLLAWERKRSARHAAVSDEQHRSAS